MADAQRSTRAPARPSAPHAAAALLAFVLQLAAVAAGASTAARGAPEVAARPSAGCAHETIATGRRLEQSITVDGVERRYIIDAPDTIRPGEPAALLFDFHGIGHSGAGVWQVSAFRELAPRERFITIYPDGLPVQFARGERKFGGPGWEIRHLTANRDVDFTIALLDRLEASYCIDRARVFSTGFSNGAYFSHVLACTHADRFAAIAPVSGGWMASWACQPARAVPVLIHHGRQDDIVAVGEARRAYEAWIAIDDCGKPAAGVSQPPAADMICSTTAPCRDGASVAYCEGDFAHRWPTSATARIWEFLRAHPLRAQ